MELINKQNAIKMLRDTFLGDTYEIDVVACGMIESLPTVDAIPIEFIQKRINLLHEMAEYDFEANGGYIGEAHVAEYELENLLTDWRTEQENRNDQTD